MTSKGETRAGQRRAQPPKIKHIHSSTRRGSTLARSIAAAHDATPEDTRTSNRRRRGESSPRDGSVALRRSGSSRRRPGADPGGGDRGVAGVRRPRGESCVVMRWVTAWGTTRGSRTVAPGWDIARFGEIGFAPWSRGEGRWARASSRRASRRASRQPRPARSKTGLGSEDESTIGSSWSSALAGEARASWCVRRAGFPACASRENLRGDCTQISRCRDRVTRCDGAYLGADAEGDATLGGGLRGELAVGDGSEETGRGGQRCAGGGRIRERHRAKKDLSTGAVAIPRCRCHRPENDAPDAIDGRSPGDRGAGGKLGSGGDESGHCCCCYVYDERVYRVLVCRGSRMRARFSSTSSSNERAVLGRLFARRPLIGCCRNSDILALGIEAKRASWTHTLKISTNWGDAKNSI